MFLISSSRFCQTVKDRVLWIKRQVRVGPFQEINFYQ
jgi:hypothetical protein